jgi:competence protein ComEC
MFLTGILMGSTGMPFFMIPAFLMLAYTTPWKEKGIRRVLFAVGLPITFILGLLHVNRELSFREQYLSKISDGQEIRLAGKVERIEAKTSCFYYYLTDCSIRLAEEHMDCNDVIAYVSDDDYSIGQILVIQGTISLFDHAANEGGFDAYCYYQSQKIDFGICADRVQCVEKSGSAYRTLLFGISQQMQEVIQSSVEDDGVLSAMLLGRKSGLDSEIKELYQQAGIAHILAISGLHVSLLGMGLYRFLRRKCRCTYLTASVWTGAFMISYAIMSGNGVSTKRAVGMLIIYLLADMLGRAYDLLSALSAMVIFLLWENPFLIGYSGFLFSVTAVLGIGVAGNILADRRAEHGNVDGANEKKRWDGLRMSLAIQLFTLPFTAYYYYEIPVYSILINFFVLMLVSPLLILTLSGAVVGLIAPEIGRIILMPCGWILGWYRWLCSVVVGLPLSHYITGKPAIWRMVLYYLILALVLLLYRQRRKQRQILQLASAAAVMLTVLLIPAGKQFEIDVLDVGQGDGIYLCTSDHVSMFIDGGSSDVSQVGTYRILPFLKSKGVKKISYWFVSHADTDHISGLKEIMKAGYRIDHLILGEAVKEEDRTSALAKLAQQSGIEVLYMEQGNSLRTAEASLSCLYPAADEDSEDVNDLCLVLQLKDHEFSGFFGGDISAEVEQKLVEQGSCAPVDFYKANHHGSKYSSSEVFLQEIAPKITVASAGKNNRYGHPAAEAVERITECGSSFACTAEDGQIKLTVKSNDSIQSCSHIGK